MFGDGSDAWTQDLLARVTRRVVGRAVHDGRILRKAHGGEVELRGRADVRDDGHVQTRPLELLHPDLQVPRPAKPRIVREQNYAREK